MYKKLIDTFKNLDQLTFKIMRYGLKFCFGICILSTIILITYNLSILSRISIIFGIEFIVCGLVVDSIKKQLI